MFRRVIIIQARIQGRRFPGKVLQTIEGKSLLERQCERLARCREIEDLCVATTEATTDDPIVDLARRLGVDCFRGSVDDVLARYVGAARAMQAEIVVRITADCPLIDPAVVDQVVLELSNHAAKCDYASNVLERTYPRGLDVEAFFVDTLNRMDRMATTASAREHVTLVARELAGTLFSVRSIRDDHDNSDLRWTVDVPADLEFLRRLRTELDFDSSASGYREIVRHIRRNPELTRINEGVATWDPAVQPPPGSSRGAA